MAISQNGWAVISSTNLNREPFPGTTVVPVPGLRSGDVATVLHYVGTQFNSRVEKLVAGWCWGFANRTVVDSLDTSNHASGTAIDLNAPNHPIGKSGTFTPQQVQKIHEILRECDGVVRWGGLYVGRKDEMHFEIIGNADQVASVANKLKGEDMFEGRSAKDWAAIAKELTRERDQNLYPYVEKAKAEIANLQAIVAELEKERDERLYPVVEQYKALKASLGTVKDLLNKE